MGREGRLYSYDWFLALDAGYDLGLLEVDLEVPGLVVARHAEGEVQVANCLGPFVGEGVLLGFLLCGAGGLFGGGEFVWCFVS